MSMSANGQYLVKSTAKVLVQLVAIVACIACAFWLFQHPQILILLGITVFVWLIATMVPATRPIAALIPMFVFGPILARRMRFRPNGRFEAIQQLPEFLSAAIRREHDRLRSELERLGFASGGMFMLSEMWFPKPGGPSEQIIFEGFSHSTRMHGAIIITLVPRQPVVQPRPALRFMEQLPDGGTMSTMNSEFPPMYPTRPIHRVLYLPGFANVSDMYTLHQKALDRLLPGHRFNGPAPDGWEVAMRDENRIAFEDYLARGFILPTSSDGEYRHHWYWNIRTTWSCIPPIMHVRRWLLQRKSRAFRQTLGI